MLGRLGRLLFVGGPGMSAFQGFLAYNSTTQTIYDRQIIAMVLDTNQFDTEGMHYTSAASLTGTVSKTSGSAALSGSGSAFLSELSVGQIVAMQKTLSGTVVLTNGSTTVAGTSTAFLTECAVGQMLNVGGATSNTLWIKSITNDTALVVDHAPQNLSPNPSSPATAYATELVAVASIASDTSATLYKNAQTSASGLTGKRVSYAACVKTAGYWDFYGYLTVTAQPAQDSPPSVLVNGLAVIGASNVIWANQANGVPPAGEFRLLPRHYAVGDIIIPTVYWDDNGSAGSTTFGGSTPYTMTVFGGYLIGT